MFTLNFGTGNINDLNTEMLYNYRRVARDCPSDGHYSYTAYTNDCFRGDWITLTEDHTPGDADGNMMLVNASPASGTFLTTTVTGLKGGTTYEFSVWMMNVCRPTEKCPFPLLPNITALVQRPDGKLVTQFASGELERHNEPEWKRYQAMFTTTPSETTLTLTMIDLSPGGCGNDFVLDDISFRECIEVKPEAVAKLKKPAVTKKMPPAPKPAPKKETPPLVKKDPPAPVPKVETPPVVKAVLPPPKPVIKEVPAVKKQPQVTENIKPRKPKVVEKLAVKPPPGKVVLTPESAKLTDPPKPQPEPIKDSVIVSKPKTIVLPPPPPIVANRANPLVKLIEAAAGEIKIDLYDNGEIDGDTISVYHNNKLLVGHARLSAKAISFTINIDSEHPHHEFVMVAHNLGSIPPNTSLMVITSGTKRYEVFISSNEQKNGKVIIDLKE